VRQYTKGAQPTLYIAGGSPLGFPRRTYADNVLVVGDAACQAKAVSGGGIFTALTCSSFAAQTAIEALETNDFSDRVLHRYHRAWTKSIGKELRKDLAIHESFSKLSDDQFEELFDIFDSPELLRVRGDIAPLPRAPYRGRGAIAIDHAFSDGAPAVRAVGLLACQEDRTARIFPAHFEVSQYRSPGAHPARRNDHFSAQRELALT